MKAVDRVNNGLPPATAPVSDDLLGLHVEALVDYAILMLDVQGNVLTWNTGAERIKGYRADEIIGRHYSIFYPAADVAAGIPGHQLEVAAAEGRITNEGWRVRSDGTRFWANVTITAIRDATHALRGFGKVTRDLTERRRAELALRESEERFRLLVVGVVEYAILMLDVEGNVTTWNAGAERFKGYRAEEIIGQHFSRFYPPEDIAAGKPERELQIAVAQGRLVDEGWRLRKDGSRFWANVTITALRDESGRLRGFGKVTRDLTERMSYERQLEQMADCDPLTGVLNERSFARELSGQVARVARYGASGGVLMIDLANFKHFNDSQGRTAGDELMVTIARGMEARLRETDTFARLGGDRFAVLVPGGDETALRTVAEALLQVARELPMPAFIATNKRVSASIGIACFSDAERLTATEILANADRAMFDAKEAGRDRWVRYHAPQAGSAPNDNSVPLHSEQVPHALAHEGFELLAQPIVPLWPDGLLSYELLLRMRDRAGVLVLPDLFLNSAERAGLSGKIDRWVARHAIDLLAEHGARGHNLRLAVNISGQTMGDQELLTIIQDELERTSVAPDRLIFEVPEAAAVAHISLATRFAESLRKLGCGFALDHFGQTFGSFYYIKHLPFDYVKIDGEFVERCGENENETDRILISAIAQVARSMHKRTIAESIGNVQTLATVTRLGVDYAQGYHLGRPAPLSEYL